MLGFHLHSVTLGDDDVPGATALGATKPMVFVLQTETEMSDDGNPAASTAGHKQIDWVTVDAC